MQSDKDQTKKSKLWPRFWHSFRPPFSLKPSAGYSIYSYSTGGNSRRLNKPQHVSSGLTTRERQVAMLSLHRHRPPSAMHALCLTFKVVDGNGSFEGEKKVWWQLDFIVQCNITERKNRLSLTLEQFVCWSGFGSRGLETSASDWMNTSDA